MELKKVSKEKQKEWNVKAKLKNAIVPEFFEVFPNKVHIICGKCGCSFRRSLIMNVDDPTFVCPNEECQAKNWVPIKYDLR